MKGLLRRFHLRRVSATALCAMSGPGSPCTRGEHEVIHTVVFPSLMIASRAPAGNRAGGENTRLIHGCFPLLADRREPRRANAISYTRRGQGWFPFGIELQDRNHPAFGLHPSLSARRCSLRDAAQEGRTPGWVTIFKHACFPLLADRREDLRRAGVSERDQLYKEGPGVVSALGSLKIETTPAPPCRGGERSRAQEGRKPC